jgi:hypothetical protein
MPIEVELDKIYMPSEEVVAREIEGEMILVPLTAGIGDMEEELFSLNETGKAIWKLLDGKRSLRDIALILSREYKAGQEEIEKDVLGLIRELFTRKIVVGKNCS